MFKLFSFITALSLCTIITSLQPSQGHAYDSSCCEPCDWCCNRAWASADYLYWKIQDSPEPVPLVVGQNVSRGPFTGTLLGGKDIKNNWRSGGRFALGYWFDNSSCLGGEVSYFFLCKGSKTLSAGPEDTESPRLRIPYFDVNLDAIDSIALSTPGRFNGRAFLKLNNTMQGAELNMLARIPSCNNCMRFGVLMGFRYWNFDENLKFIVNSGLATIPSFFNTVDKFDVQNNFYGGQIGGSFDYTYCSFFLNVKAKIALGAMCQRLLINGHFETDEISDTAVGPTREFVGGIFALPTNIGSHKKTRFSAIPEVDVNFGYQVTDCFRLQVGYTALYVTNVLWAGKQIDPNINTTQSIIFDFPAPQPPFSGEKAPIAKMKSSGLWVQGVNAGFEFEF